MRIRSAHAGLQRPADAGALAALQAMKQAQRRSGAAEKRRIAGDADVRRARRAVKIVLADYFSAPEVTLRSIEKSLHGGEGAAGVCWALHINPGAFAGKWQGEGAPKTAPRRAFAPDEAELRAPVTELAAALTGARAREAGQESGA